MRYFLMVAALLVSGCGSQIYDAAEAGRFDGSVLVMWVGAGSPEQGDGKFVYVPDPRFGEGLTFTRSKEVDGETVNVKEITPEWMYTDGGSIPRRAQPFKGLNPWGYAPAYMVHDWLFVARKCLLDGMATESEAKMEKVTFRESYEIMAEMVKTLEQTQKISGNDVRPAAITWAVTSGVSRSKWEGEGACSENRLTPEHRRQIERRLGVSPSRLTAAIRRSTIAGPEMLTPAAAITIDSTAPTAEAELVAVITFP